MARLVLETGDEAGQVFELGSSAVIGRLASCDIPIKDRKSSRNNTRVYQESGAWFVEDMGSSNGTFLNEARIKKSPLRPGDKVTIGTTTFNFEPGKPATVSSPRPAAGKAPAPQRPGSSPGKRPSGPVKRPSGPVKRPSGPVGAPSPAKPAPDLRKRVAAIETPPAGVPVAPSPRGSTEDIRKKLASFETPPAGVAPPAELADEIGLGDEESVEELDFGSEDDGPAVQFPSAPAPEPEKPKVQVQFRVPIRSETRGRGGNVMLQDVSQRSAAFRAMVYLGAVLIMAVVGYLAFRMVSGAF